ncbi:MAG: hypothetical protein ICV63_09220 [Coleofasciculus sp. Co-bin14]|nr:hypothetical protein [Coleofasciculus sp. Co-bin14]
MSLIPGLAIALVASSKTSNAKNSFVMLIPFNKNVLLKMYYSLQTSGFT